MERFVDHSMLPLPVAGSRRPPQILRHKITPAPGGGVPRPRLIERIRESRVVTIVAPGGYGKRTLAAQIAESRQGRIAWYTADATDTDPATIIAYLIEALQSAWPDASVADAETMTDSAATTHLAYTVEELGGIGTVVVDALHLLPAEAASDVLATLTRALPREVTLVVCSETDPPLDRLTLRSSGALVCLGPEDLQFTVDEARAILGDDEQARAAVELTGGWPLAVGLAAEGVARADTDSADDSVLSVEDQNELARRALAEVDAAGMRVLALLARVPGAPEEVLRDQAGAAFAGLQQFVARHPSLISISDDRWWTPRGLIRTVLRDVEPDPRDADSFAYRLAAHDRHLAFVLLRNANVHEEAAAHLDELVADLMEAARWRRTRQIVADVPRDLVSPNVRLMDAAAAFWLHEITEDELEALRTELAEHGPVFEGYASYLHAFMLFRRGDVRAVEIIIATLRTLLDGRVDDASITAALTRLDAPASGLLASLAQAYALCLLLAGSKEHVERGRRMLTSVLEYLPAHMHGRDLPSAIGQWILAVTGAVDPERAIAQLDLARANLAGSGKLCAGLVTLMIADVQVLAGHLGAARRLLSEAQDWAEVSESDRFLLDAERVGIYADAAGDVSDDELLARADAHWSAGLADAMPMAAFAVRMGHELLDRTAPDAVPLWLARADATAPVLAHVRFERDALEVRSRIHAGDPRASERGLEIARAQRRAGLDHAARTLVARLCIDVAATGATERADAILRENQDRIPARLRTRVAAASEVYARAQPSPDSDAAGIADNTDATDIGTPALEIRVLRPEIEILQDGRTVTAPKGYRARLLALLVANNGVVELDRAIEELWPGADPDAGRDRAYVVVYRLRRALGLPKGSPLGCADGLIRLEATEDLVVDAWDLRTALESQDADATRHALALYADDFCAQQFAYDEFAIQYRRGLRHACVRAAKELLVVGGPGDDVAADADLARRMWSAAPEDEELCLAAIRAVARSGATREALDMLDVSADHVAELGFDTADLLERGRSLLGLEAS